MACPAGWAAEGRALAAALDDGTTDPIVIHLFSNAGFWTWASALPRLDDVVRDRVVGVVIDSAPGFPERIEPRFYSRYAAMAVMPMILRRLGRGPALRHPLLTPPLQAFMWLWYHLSPGQRRVAEWSLSTVGETGAWPHLFLYSTADSLVPFAYVERFLRRVRDAAHVRWDDSEHVTHMIRHRHAYFDAVARFLAPLVPSGSAP